MAQNTNDTKFVLDVLIDLDRKIERMKKVHNLLLLDLTAGKKLMPKLGQK